MPTPPPTLFQLCLVVHDVHQANAHWAKVLDRPLAEVQTLFPDDGSIHHHTHGQPATYTDLQVAKYALDAFVLELMQPGAGASPWRDFLDRHGPGVFHVCMGVEDRPGFLQTLAEIGVGQPYHVGEYAGGSYSYVDASAQLGLELSINHQTRTDTPDTARPAMDIHALRKLVARTGGSVLETLDIRTGARTVLKTFDVVIEAPNWTRDGRRLVYNSEGRMYAFTLATGEVTPIDTGFATDCNNDHVLSPDNTRLAISHFTNEDAASRIYTLPLEGGTPTLVTPQGPSYLHGWSPDGERLAYCAERGGQYDIYTIGVHGGPETRLTDTPGLDDGPEYSPDGRSIWFNSTRSGLMQLWRMDVDGANPTHMVQEDANGWFPHVSPDGQWVVYVAYGKDDVAPGDHPPNKWVELRLVPASGGASRTLAKLFGGQGTINVNSWAPDSRTLAFVSYGRPDALTDSP